MVLKCVEGLQASHTFCLLMIVYYFSGQMLEKLIV
jgi:hypothetical protein